MPSTHPCVVVGEDKYPHAYNDYEHFKFEHAEMPYLEYPIENKNRLYEGSGKPGPDHVVIGSIAEDYRRFVTYSLRQGSPVNADSS